MKPQRLVFGNLTDLINLIAAALRTPHLATTVRQFYTGSLPLKRLEFRSRLNSLTSWQLVGARV